MLNKTMDEFNELYGLERKPVDHDLESMVNLIVDEVDELLDDVHGDSPIENVIKEAIDTIYITAQQLRERGVDLDAALAEVHRSNMSKCVEVGDGDKITTEILQNRELTVAKERYPSAMIVNNYGLFNWIVKCADTGKVIKPTTYSPAVITKDMY
jgi:NTP pyrophosphatase (non-canonical NTP hydrolase)